MSRLAWIAPAVSAALIALAPTAGASPTDVAPPAAAATATVATPIPESTRLTYDVAAGAVGAAVSVPLMLGLGTWLGSMPSNLILGAGPPLLLLLLIPPLITVLAELEIDERAGGSGARFWPAFLVTTGVQLAAIAGGIAAGVSSRRPLDVALFSLAEAVVLPASATVMIELTREDRIPPPPAMTVVAFTF